MWFCRRERAQLRFALCAWLLPNTPPAHHCACARPSPHRFNTGEGTAENAIVTSTGQYVVAWDFARVKKGYLDKYEIKWCVLPSAIPALLHPADATRFLRYEDQVVQDNFRFGDDKEIVRPSPRVVYCSEPT